MKIIYLGTPEFAVKPLINLINSHHEVVAVVTQPDRPVGRKGIITPPPVKVTAKEYGVPVYQFESVSKEGVEALSSLKADAMITCAYGQILSESVIKICPLGIYNIHASLLPKYRGASPIQAVIINGEKTTGVTFMKTDVGLDTGDIVKSYSLDIFENETFGSLSERLSVLGAENVVSVMDEIESGKANFIKQNDELSSVVKTIKNADCVIDFSKTAEEVKNLINGLSPTPCAYTFLNGKRLKIYGAKLSDISGNQGAVTVENGKIKVCCSVGSIEITSLQEEGGKAMDGKSFILGRKIKTGDILGNA